jgi:hypothetical protein
MLLLSSKFTKHTVSFPFVSLNSHVCVTPLIVPCTLDLSTYLTLEGHQLRIIIWNNLFTCRLNCPRILESEFVPSLPWLQYTGQIHGQSQHAAWWGTQYTSTMWLGEQREDTSVVLATHTFTACCLMSSWWGVMWCGGIPTYLATGDICFESGTVAESMFLVGNALPRFQADKLW